MKEVVSDVVFPMQKAYTALLNGMTYLGVPVPVFYQLIPDGINPPNYIIFGQIRENDTSTMNSRGSTVSIQVKVHTQGDKYNDGVAVAAIAGEVIKRVYPLNGPHIDLSADGLQLFSTKKTNDFTSDWTLENQRVYIDRILQFTHNIYYL